MNKDKWGREGEQTTDDRSRKMRGGGGGGVGAAEEHSTDVRSSVGRLLGAALAAAAGEPDLPGEEKAVVETTFVMEVDGGGWR